MEHLQSKGIATRPGTHAVHMLGYYREKFGLKPEDYPPPAIATPIQWRFRSTTA